MAPWGSDSLLLGCRGRDEGHLPLGTQRTHRLPSSKSKQIHRSSLQTAHHRHGGKRGVSFSGLPGKSHPKQTLRDSEAGSPAGPVPQEALAGTSLSDQATAHTSGVKTASCPAFLPQRVASLPLPRTRLPALPTQCGWSLTYKGR